MCGERPPTRSGRYARGLSPGGWTNPTSDKPNTSAVQNSHAQTPAPRFFPGSRYVGGAKKTPTPAMAAILTAHGKRSFAAAARNAPPAQKRTQPATDGDNLQEPSHIRGENSGNSPCAQFDRHQRPQRPAARLRGEIPGANLSNH